MGKLPKPRFNLKSPNAEKETLISLIFRYRGKKLQYSTGLNIHPKDWDGKTQRPVIQDKRKDLFATQNTLNDLECHTLDIYMESDSISIKAFKK